MFDADSWLDMTTEEREAKWAIAYQDKAARKVAQQLRSGDDRVRIPTAATFAWLAETLNFPVWLVPRKVKPLDKLVETLIARPQKSPVYLAYHEVCEEIPEDSCDCAARGIVFNWPHFDSHMVFHDLMLPLTGGHGWFFHMKQPAKRLILQPLSALVEGLINDEWRAQ